ncbi:hypothetical protein CLU79DRAFT_813755 [Phycomyces nitens]|nr:hypothetical protein CLU79DRAFT_813755 [Phycomyces nitens]
MTSLRQDAPPRKSLFSFGDEDQDDDDQFIKTVQPLPRQAVERSAFTAAEFDPDRFLSSRRHLGLERLKTELNNHLRLLKAELIELLNRDYQDFINLSTNLKGVDRAMDDLMRPLTRMETQVKTASVHFQQVIDALEKQLDQRAHVRDKKACLKLLLNIHDSVTKVESLLEINVDTTKTSVNTPAVVDAEGSDVSVDIGLGKQIERVAIEFNQMQHLVGRGKDLPFVTENAWRITRIKDTLQSKLSKTLSGALWQLKDNPADKAAHLSLVQCLRTYALIDQVQVAENLIRQELVRPFLSKVITKKALDIHRTGRSPEPTVHPLTAMYAKILKFASTDLQPIIEITQRTLKGTNYEVLVNSLWVEVVEKIHGECTSIYAAGQTDVFHKCYSASISFMLSIEGLCTCKKSLFYLRSHPSYTEFMKRWQLPVYFQLRFREIISTVEELLNDQQSSVATRQLVVENGLALPGSKAVFKAMEQCWSDQVFLYGLSHRFWKLTVQLLRRYTLWVSGFIESARDNFSEKEKTNLYSAINTSSRPSTPRPGTPAGNIHDTGVIEEATRLKQLTVLENDVETLVNKTTALLNEVMLPKLPNTIPPTLLRESMNEAMQTLERSTLEDLNGRITDIVSRRCMESVNLVKSITSQYRHTNKPVPTEPSYFIPNLFKPFKTFVGQNESWTNPEKQAMWAKVVCSAVLTRYTSVMSEMLTNLQKTEDSLRKLKKSKKSAVSSVQGDPLGESFVTDENKIRLQLLIDARQIGNELCLLGINKDEFKPFGSLLEAVQPFECLE